MLLPVREDDVHPWTASTAAAASAAAGVAASQATCPAAAHFESCTINHGTQMPAACFV